MSNVWISRDDIFAALQMRQVLEHYGIKSSRGSSFRIHCPFHEDDRPSCSINPTDKVYNCFGCNSKGNVLDFIAEMEGLDPAAEFRAVLEVGVEILGHNPSQKRNRGTKSASNSKSKSNPNAIAQSNANMDEGEEENTKVSSIKVKRPKQSKSASNRKGKIDDAVDAQAPAIESEAQAAPMNDDDEADDVANTTIEPNRVLEGPAFPLKLDPSHAYLKQRGISKSLATKFGIGFETRSSALMAGRICFPIHNARGELVAYSGRWVNLSGDDDFVDGKGREQERYKLPTGFKKQLELYNLHRVLEEFPDTSTIVLVEGFWSVLRLFSLTRSIIDNGNEITGIPTVALMGLSLSKQQMELLSSNGIRNIILMLDGDDEGRTASKRLLSQLASSFFVKDAYLSDGTKPDNVDQAFLTKFVKDHFPHTNRQVELKPAKAAKANTIAGSTKAKPKRSVAKQTAPKPVMDYSIGTSWSQ